MAPPASDQGTQVLNELLLRSGKRIAVPGQSQRHRPMLSSGLDCLPRELLETVLLSWSRAEDLCRIACTCKRLQAVADDVATWQRLFKERWTLNALTTASAKLAGSWKALYRSKAGLEKVSDGWSKSSPFEVQAAIEQMVEQATLQESRKAAVIFLLDGSGSMVAEDFTMIAAFVSDATEAICKAASSTQVGVCQFSNDVKVEYALQKPEKDGLKKALDSMEMIGGGTNIAGAIQKAGQLLKDAGPDCTRTVVIMSDGRINPYQGIEAVQMASQLVDEQSGVSIFGIGVGRGVEKAELENVINSCGSGVADMRYLALCTNEHAPW